MAGKSHRSRLRVVRLLWLYSLSSLFGLAPLWVPVRYSHRIGTFKVTAWWDSKEIKSDISCQDTDKAVRSRNDA